MLIQLLFKDLDLLNEDHIRSLITDIESRENRVRKSEAYEAYQVFAGNQKAFVKNLLKINYPKTHAKFRAGNINFTERVVVKRSKAYKNPPLRTLDTDDVSKNKDTESIKYQEILKDNKANRAFKEFDEIFNLHRYAALWVNFVNPEDDSNEEGKYLFQALAPYEYDLFRDEVTGKPVIFALNFINVNDAGVAISDHEVQILDPKKVIKFKKYSFWNDTQHVQVIVSINIDGKIRSNASIKYIKLAGNKDNKNPIGKLPIAFLSRGLNFSYPVANPLHKQALDWNLDYSDLRTASVVQGHGQLVISHSDKQAIPKELHMGQHQSIDLPQKEDSEIITKAEYINANPDLAGQLSVLKFDAIQILEDHGVKAKGSIEGGVEEFSSGFDRLLASADAIDILEDNQDLYEDNVEQDVYQVVKATEDALNKNKFKAERVNVIFEKPKVLISDKETLANIKLRGELGTLLAWEKHIILNPNLSQEEAEAREEEIQKQEDVKIQKGMDNDINKFKATIGNQKQEGFDNGKGSNKNAKRKNNFNK